MFFSNRISLKALSQFCHRLATATNAGIQDRKIWTDEAGRGSASQRQNAATVRDELAMGNSITEALQSTGGYYPPLFRKMIEVGEVSGRLGEIYKRLGRHYDRVLSARRDFWQRLIWPLFQLGIALLVIGLLIWIMGMIPGDPTSPGSHIDILGLGLIGTSGLMKYLSILLFIAVLILLVVKSILNGALWARKLQRLTLQIPVLGDALKTLALAKFTWALQLVLDTPMDLRKALPLALHSTGSEHYSEHSQEIVQRIEQGQSITQSLASTGIFPSDLLDNIAVGEESGRLVETMERQAIEYEERAGSAIAILAQFAGYAIWALVAVFIIVMIFRIFSFYVNTINSLT
ncbi:type II secretion system F family protein [Bythopirellula polymerisocia]|uniref:Type II secretion system protein F n=1 Tax=Bythopirellula polymerisocia TaxID=2528003 RepID=A0A5C6CCT1_9BACT|nr:type II secretion system F family protein [Bythopirellula polymerisocia]TWU21281.1 Type II secretion system protein F [Bythopirellula polymerisocia]